MGFSIVRLGRHVPALSFAPLPASKWVVAVSPILKGSDDPPQYAWANTILGDPKSDATGVISYLSTRSDANLNRFGDAIAVNQSGQVVAVLSTDHLWYSAQFVARIAYIVATGRGCHASLGIVGSTAQGGGVNVSRVIPKSPAQWQLKKGDVITALNGKPTETFDALDTALYLTPAFTEAHVTFVRDATVHHAVMTLACAL
jgi:S1-C subfamily serine protease